MLDVDPVGTGSLQVPHQLFKGGRIAKRIVGEKIEKNLRLRLQMGRSDLTRVLLRLFGKDNHPVHQPGSVEVLSSGSAIPLRMESRMPGMETR